MVFPWVQFLKKGGAGRLSDIEYLAIKEFDGKLVKNEGFLSATGTLATLTASAGKDMYVASAKVIFYLNVAGGATAIADKVELQINGTVVETATSSQEHTGATSESGIAAWSYEFKNIGYKVTESQVIKLEVITLDSEVDVEGYVQCIEETTGESPQI